MMKFLSGGLPHPDPVTLHQSLAPRAVRVRIGPKSGDLKTGRIAMTESETITIKQVDHIGIRVADLDRAMAFYGVLGFEFVYRSAHDAVVIVKNAQGIEINLIFGAVIERFFPMQFQ